MMVISPEISLKFLFFFPIPFPFRVAPGHLQAQLLLLTGLGGLAGTHGVSALLLVEAAKTHGLQPVKQPVTLW